MAQTHTLPSTLWTTRVIRHNFRRGGLAHLATVHETYFDHDGERTLQVTHPYITFCGKHLSPGQGGWGYGEPCPACHAVGAKAEQL